MNFREKYDAAVVANNSLLCVGLDSDIKKLPECLKNEKNPLKKFNDEIIAATKDLVCAYKPNAAFYESAGALGLEAWEAVCDAAPSIPMIADVKRGDIGNTAEQYAVALYTINTYDAATVNPYMGWDAIEPFYRYEDKYSFVLALTSNKSAADFEYHADLFKVVAKTVHAWNEKGSRLGLVVGATKPEELGEIRKMCPDEIFLIPGIGSQGGDVEKTVKNGFGGKHGNMVINVSRAIIFASTGTDFAAKAREQAMQYRDMINNYRS